MATSSSNGIQGRQVSFFAALAPGTDSSSHRPSAKQSRQLSPPVPRRSIWRRSASHGSPDRNGSCVMVDSAVSLMIGEPLVDVPRDGSIESADHEIKFAVPASVADPLRMWLASVCRPDAAHPPASVWTVYFDTPGLALLSEKIASDYLKTKVRVRWYGAVGHRQSPVFAEVKQ